MENNIVVYFVAENGFINPGLIKCFLNMFEEKGYTVRDIGTGSAFNMPVYLLGEIEEHIEEAVVVSVYWDGDEPKPMVFFDGGEIDAVIRQLEVADETMDSFDILREVHKQIRN